MLVRNMHEVEYKTVFSNYKYGLMAWGPLAGGILTGKYLNGIPENEVSRFNDNKFFFPLDVLKTIHYNPFATQKTIKKLQDLSALAESVGFKLTHLALAWVIKFQYTTSALIGARTAAQAQECLKALDMV